MKNVIFDMETGDPDDVFALCFITSHPDLHLRAVTVNPGTDKQIGVVKQILGYTGNHHVPVGSKTPSHKKECVSKWHYDWMGKIHGLIPDAKGCDLINSTFKRYPNILLITGAALSNPSRALEKYPDIEIDRWVAQGGFAGDSVVPEQYRLDKFKGKETCPTYNFNGDVKAAKFMLSTDRIKKCQLISKNVCHGVLYDKEMHKKIEPYKKDSPGLSLIYDGMSKYLERKPFKAFHDPLAACFAADPSICQIKDVEVYREKGKWGSKITDTPNAQISYSCDVDKFIKTLTMTGDK